MYARTVEMLSESAAMTVHLNSFPLSLAKSCCWTVTNYFHLEMLKCVDGQVNSNDKGKETAGGGIQERIEK